MMKSKNARRLSRTINEILGKFPDVNDSAYWNRPENAQQRDQINLVAGLCMGVKVACQETDALQIVGSMIQTLLRQLSAEKREQLNAWARANIEAHRDDDDDEDVAE